MASLSDVLKRSEELLDASRPVAAVRLLEQVAGKISDRAYQGMVQYNMGCLYRSAIGNGDRARACLAAASEVLAEIPDTRVAKTLRPNALENRMLLALSYDEYFALADELRRLNPDADILRGHVPVITRSRDQGHAWFETMDGIAHSYYDRGDAQRDAGLYGEAASTFHTLLTHRKQLRVSREGWRRAALEYGNLCLRLGADTSVRAEKKNPLMDPREFVPIVADALPQLDQYLAANPTDQDADYLASSMRRWTKTMSEAEPPPRVYEPLQEEDSDTMSMRCPGCHHQLSAPLANCPECGRPLVRMGVVMLKSLAAGVVTYFVIAAGLESGPVWIAVLAAFIASTVAFGVSTASETIRLMGPGGPRGPVIMKSAAVRRQQEIDSLITIRGRSKVRCRNGHEMQSMECEGVLLAACPVCGIVKPYPGTMARFEDIQRVAGKFDKFDF